MATVGVKGLIYILLTFKLLMSTYLYLLHVKFQLSRRNGVRLKAATHTSQLVGNPNRELVTN